MQLTFPFVYRRFLMEVGKTEPIGYYVDCRDWYTSGLDLHTEDGMIYCGLVLK